MKREIFTIPSYAGRDISIKHITDDNSSLAVYFPGQNYSCELPLLHYLGKVGLESNHDLLMLEYGYQSARIDFDPDKIDEITSESHNAIMNIAGNYKEIVFISKSLGTVIAGKVDRLMNDQWKVSHIFLTPIKSSIPFINKAPRGLIIWGTNDPALNEDDLMQIHFTEERRLHKIIGGNHALEVGDVYQSLSVISEIVKVGQNFLMKKNL